MLTSVVRSKTSMLGSLLKLLTMSWRWEAGTLPSSRR